MLTDDISRSNISLKSAETSNWGKLNTKSKREKENYEDQIECASQKYKINQFLSIFVNITFLIHLQNIIII